MSRNQFSMSNQFSQNYLLPSEMTLEKPRSGSITLEKSYSDFELHSEMESGDLLRTRTLILVLLMSYFGGAARAESCPSAIFAFGASMTDTGNSQAAFPYQSAAENSPYGETFFRRPSNRWSNGRVVVDFLAQALKIPLLSPHMQSVGNDFTHGANFAFSGVTTQNNSYPWTVSPPFYFWIQTRQFRRFKERTRALWENAQKGGANSRRSLQLLTKLKYFRSGLYFVTFGANDFIVPLLGLGQTMEQVQSSIVNISNAMVANTEELYNQGARKLMVFNVPPLGCYPAFLTSPRMRNMSTVDTYGCLETLNAAIQATNSLIRTGLRELQVKHPDATFIYADLYEVLQKLVRNGRSYGFRESFKACCGAGGVRCGASAVINGTQVEGNSCSKPGTYIHWDGIHITDAAAGFVAKTFLQGEHLEPSYTLAKLCRLDYKQFP